VLIVLATAPALQSFFNLLPTMAVDEHRNPAPAPDLSLFKGPDVAKFADQLNAWFDDRIGFRDIFIRTKNQLDLTFFRVNRKVYLGSEEWLFQRSLTDARFVFESIGEDQYLEVEQSFSDLAATLRRRGIRLVVVDYPDKSEFYPEYLPSDVPNLPENGKLARLRRALDANPGLIHIDVKKLLRPLKRDGEPLFSKTDIHNNVPGGIPIVKEIVRRVAQEEDRDIVWNEPFHRVETESSSSESRFLSVLFPVTERSISVSDPYEIGKPVADGHWVTDDPRRMDYPVWGKFPIFDFEFISNPELCPQRLPAAAMFGNSFSDIYWALGLQRYFCRLRRARDPMERLRAYIDDLPPETKYFIFQFFGPFLPGGVPMLSSPANSALPAGVVANQ
jgi:hypothetical protein